MNLSPTHLKIALHIRSGLNACRELQQAIGNGSMLTQEYLNDLKQAGLVTWEPYQSRTLQLTEQGRTYLANYVLLPGGGIGKWEPIEPAKEPVYCTADEYEAMQW